MKRSAPLLRRAAVAVSLSLAAFTTAWGASHQADFRKSKLKIEVSVPEAALTEPNRWIGSQVLARQYFPAAPPAAWKPVSVTTWSTKLASLVPAAAAEETILLIRLNRWGLDRHRDPECSFTAVLRTQAGDIDLGQHRSTHMSSGASATTRSGSPAGFALESDLNYVSTKTLRSLAKALAQRMSGPQPSAAD